MAAPAVRHDVPRLPNDFGLGSGLRRSLDLPQVRSLGGARLYDYLVRTTDDPGLAADATVVRIVFDERVYFDTASWDIRAEAQPTIEAVAAVLDSVPRPVAVYVTGHTDSRGPDDYNFDLSVRRAETVANRLHVAAPSAQIWSVGFGKAVPLRPNTSVANMAANRRVEFVVSLTDEAARFWLQHQSEFSCKVQGRSVGVLCPGLLGPTQAFTPKPAIADLAAPAVAAAVVPPVSPSPPVAANPTPVLPAAIAPIVRPPFVQTGDVVAPNVPVYDPVAPIK